MSFQALASVRDVMAPSSSALMLLYILAEYAGPDGCCYPSQQTLAERAQLSVRAVGMNLSLLRKAGLVEQQQRRRKDGSRTSDLFRLTYYSPEQGADTAACEITPTPRKGRQEIRPQNLQCDRPQNSTRQAAIVAGLTSFEPVTEHISLDARERRSPLPPETPLGLAGGLVAVPPEIRAKLSDDPRFGEGFCRSWIDHCAFNPATRELHARSEFARGQIRERVGHKHLIDLGLVLGEPLPASAAARPR